MKHARSLSIAIALAIVSSTAIAQSSTSPAPANLPPGTKAQAELSSAIDSKKAHGGDQFKARLWKDIHVSDKLTLPQKTTLVGHVINAQPHTNAASESRLTMAFDKAILKDGTEIPLHGVIEGVELSAMAASAAQNSNADLHATRNVGSTTNYAMPSGSPQESQGQVPAFGPTGVLDPNLVLKVDAAGNLTIFNSTTKADVKIRDHSTLDIIITQAGN